MAYEITAAHGCKVQIGDGAQTEAFSDIKGIHNGPNGPGTEPQFIEANHHGTDDIIQKPTRIRKTPVTFDIYYDGTDANHAALLTASENKARKNFKQILTDQGDTTYEYAAYVSATYKGDVDGWNVYSITLTIDGAVERTVTP